MRSLKYICSNGETGSLPYEDTLYKLVQWYKTEPIQVMELVKNNPFLKKEILSQQ